MHSDRYAPTTTLPGLLQRGRGQGALIAAEDPSSVADLVHGCIRWDWRWDRRLDSRHVYLARLIRDLGLPFAVPVGEMRAREVEPATPEPTPGQDMPTLIAALEEHWVTQTWRGPAALARALARFGPEAAEAAGAAPAVSLLRRFWLATPHSYERPAYLEALAAMGAPGLPEVYVESLWDCEPRARLLAVEHAPDRPGVRDRLGYLRDDPIEEPDVREAAATRLAALAWAPPAAAKEPVRRGLE
ncbi:hypothetical protein [Kitasatospora brasiliensis]|uniref:hypothetical protein n=1 Tax=Kitasatospora brasiliensis TaxID=3058040 RepID=UPI0029308767|nr:hypothetical protein [Kitasatospora sp. K002]